MNKTLLVGFAVGVMMLGGCGVYVAPVTKTNVEGEYVVRASDQKGPLSSLELAQQAAIKAATESCESMGRVYEKSYVLDRGLSSGQVPESTLYFRCVARK